MKPLIYGAVAVGIVLIGILITNNQRAVGNLENGNEPQINVTPNPQTVREIEIEAGSYYFRPNELRVKKGEAVRITINSVSMMHSFVVDELNIESEIIQSGNSGTVEFTANQAGVFEYYCSVGDHRQRGQVGTLVVEE